MEQKGLLEDGEDFVKLTDRGIDEPAEHRHVTRKRRPIAARPAAAPARACGA